MKLKKGKGCGFKRKEKEFEQQVMRKAKRVTDDGRSQSFSRQIIMETIDQSARPLF